MLYHTGRQHFSKPHFCLYDVLIFCSTVVNDNFFQLSNKVKIGLLCHPALQYNIQDCSLSAYLMPGCRNLACISLLRPTAIGYYCCFNISVTREMLHWLGMTSIHKKQPKGTTGWHVPITSRVALIQWFTLTLNSRCVHPFWWDNLTLYCDVVHYLPILDDLVRWPLSPLIQSWLKPVSI